MEPLAELDDLKARLDWELDEKEESLGEEALDDLSDDARYYGSSLWVDLESTPRQVQKLVVRAAARFMKNPDGLEQSRAGDETVIYSKHGEWDGSAKFNDREIKQLQSFTGKGGLTSVPIIAWGTKLPTGPGYVPTDGGLGRPFPWFVSTDGPW